MPEKAESGASAHLSRDPFGASADAFGAAVAVGQGAVVHAGARPPDGRRPARPSRSGRGTRAPSPPAFRTPDTASRPPTGQSRRLDTPPARLPPLPPRPVDRCAGVCDRRGPAGTPARYAGRAEAVRSPGTKAVQARACNQGGGVLHQVRGGQGRVLATLLPIVRTCPQPGGRRSGYARGHIPGVERHRRHRTDRWNRPPRLPARRLPQGQLDTYLLPAIGLVIAPALLPVFIEAIRSRRAAVR